MVYRCVHELSFSRISAQHLIHLVHSTFSAIIVVESTDVSWCILDSNITALFRFGTYEQIDTLSKNPNKVELTSRCFNGCISFEMYALFLRRVPSSDNPMLCKKWTNGNEVKKLSVVTFRLLPLYNLQRSITTHSPIFIARTLPTSRPGNKILGINL